MSTVVLLATCAEFPEGEDADAGLPPALRAVGLEPRWRSWTDGGSWDACTVIRSTWDYTGQRERYLTWTRSVPRLHNPAEVVAWNSDKRYLAELAEAGLAVTPTEWVPPGQRWSGTDHAEFVVKPSVGAGSRGAGRFVGGEHDDARQHIAHLHDQGRVAMVQPYLDLVDVTGEAALLYFDGRFSHAITKGAMLPTGTRHRTDGYALFVPENISPRTPSAAERAAGDAAVAFLTERFGPLLYARIDLLPGPDGPVVVEVEVTEPSLFLSYAEGAPDRFAAAIAARA